MNILAKNTGLSLLGRKNEVLFSTFIIFSYISIFLQIFLTLEGLRTGWTCTTTAPEQKYEYLCYKLMRFSTCRHYKGPVSHDVIIDLQTESEAFLSVRCTWDEAQSGFRLILDFFTIFCLFKSFKLFPSAIRVQPIESKIFYSFLASLHLLASTTDYWSLLQSLQLNHSKCSGSLPEHLGSGVSIKSSSCSYFSPTSTACCGFIQSLLLVALTLFQPLSKSPKSLKTFQ